MSAKLAEVAGVGEHHDHKAQSISDLETGH